MYAAAGGASLASRKARQNKQKKFQAQQAQIRATSEIVAPRVQQSRQFHQLPANYLRTPGSGQTRKLSATSFAAQSKLLLPIHEGHHQHPHTHHHRHPAGGGISFNQHSQYHSHLPHGAVLHHSRQNLHHLHGRQSTQRLSTQTEDGLLDQQRKPHLTKSATASFPLVSHVEATPPATPLISIDANKLIPPGASSLTGVELVNVDEALLVTTTTTTVDTDAVPSLVVGVDDHKDKTDLAVTTTTTIAAAATTTTSSANETIGLQVLPVPQDSIIITPATPLASPGHSIRAATSTQLQDAEEKDFFGPGPFRLERKCSFYRVRPRRSNAFETHDDCQSFLDATGHELTQAQILHYRDYTDDSVLLHPAMGNGNVKDMHKYSQCAYCEDGICLCEHIECAQGRAAWLERERIRRCSVQDKENNTPASCHRKWVKRNRIQDSSLGGSSDDEDLLGVLRGPSNFANAFLYVGLGTVAIGLVIAFVGTGEKGFKTVELRLIGPSLIGIGLICCILRICFCICPSSCISSSRRARKKNSNKVDADHTTSLLRGENKRVSIAKGPHRFPLGRKKSNNKMMNEGMEALRQIATTSLFMQNEQKTASSNRVVPIIKEPENLHDSPLEMRKLDTTLNISDITDDEDEDDESQAIIPPSNHHQQQTAQSYRSSAATAIKQSNNLNNTISTNDAHEIIDEESSPSAPLVRTQSKLARKRLSMHQQKQQPSHHELPSPPSILASAASKVAAQREAELLMETSLMDVSPSAADSSRGQTTKAGAFGLIPPPTVDTNLKAKLSDSNKLTILPSTSSSTPNSNSKAAMLPPPPSSMQSQSLSAASTTSAASAYIPASTTLIAPRSTYDLPKSATSSISDSPLTEAQQQQQNYRRQQQEKLFQYNGSSSKDYSSPGQILDLQSASKAPPSTTFASQSSSRSLFLPSAEEGAIGGTRLNGNTNLLLQAKPPTSATLLMPTLQPTQPSSSTLSSSSLLGSQLILTPLLLPGSVAVTTNSTTMLPSSTSLLSSSASASSSTINNNNYNMLSNSMNMNKPSTSMSINLPTSQLQPPPLTGLQTEPELVLSPAKLGQ